MLAGLCDGEQTLRGTATEPETIVHPHNEREWDNWRPAYRSAGQAQGTRFVPLSEVRDEKYTVYFPVQPG